MFSKPLSTSSQPNAPKLPTIHVAQRATPTDFKEVTISNANNIFFKAFGEIKKGFDEMGFISESNLAKFRGEKKLYDYVSVISVKDNSSPLARQRIKELKGMKKTFFKEMEIDAKKGSEMIEKSLRFYEALLEAERLRSTKGEKRKSKPSTYGKA